MNQITSDEYVRANWQIAHEAYRTYNTQVLDNKGALWEELTHKEQCGWVEVIKKIHKLGKAVNNE